MPVLRADDRIPKIGKPSDVPTLLAGYSGDRPKDLRDRASSFGIDRTQINPVDGPCRNRPSRPAPSAGRLDRQRGPLGPIAADHHPG
jgi:hypothetical protein